MKKIKILYALVPIIFLGCAQNKPMAPTKSTYSETSHVESVDNVVNQTSLSVDVINACKDGNITGCSSFADTKYQSGEFYSAISGYDMNCARQHIPSCLKMANMFEKGEGVVRNLPIALDIYTRACYGGHNRSCNDMKRLEKVLGRT